MVRAIIDGRKTQTRRVVRELPGNRGGLVGDHVKWFERGRRDHTRWCGHDGIGSLGWVTCPLGEPGARLWVREAWGLHAYGDETDWLRGSVRGLPADSLRAQYNLALRADWGPVQEGCHWRPGIFMPRWASRITLEVTEVRVQRLQEIGEDDALAEGVEPGDAGDADLGGTARGAFHRLWDSINGKRAPWAGNPWVWAVSFRRVS
jgi:hypothetical protein